MSEKRLPRRTNGNQIHSSSNSVVSSNLPETVSPTPTVSTFISVVSHDKSHDPQNLTHDLFSTDHDNNLYNFHNSQIPSHSRNSYHGGQNIQNVHVHRFKSPDPHNLQSVSRPISSAPHPRSDSRENLTNNISRNSSRNEILLVQDHSMTNFNNTSSSPYHNNNNNPSYQIPHDPPIFQSNSNLKIIKNDKDFQQVANNLCGLWG